MSKNKDTQLKAQNYTELRCFFTFYPHKNSWTGLGNNNEAATNVTVTTVPAEK